MIRPSSTRRARLGRMWCAGIIVTVVLFTNHTMVRGQDTADPAPAGRPAAPADAAPPIDEATAIQLFSVAENWVRRTEVPDKTISLPVSKVAAVYVTVRMEGVTLGQGIASLDNPLRAAALKQVDVVGLLQIATRAALRDAESSLARLASQPGQNVAMPADLAAVGPLLKLDLQIAGPLHRMQLERVSDVLDYVRVGVQGLAMQHNGRWGWVFPGTAIASNTRIESQVQQLLNAVGLDITAMRTIGREDGPAMFWYEAIHLVRGPDGDVQPLYRGQPQPDRRRMSMADIIALREAWAAHLLARQRPDGRFAATYEPTGDKHTAERSAPRDAALAVLALSRLADVSDDSARASLYRQAAAEGMTAVLEDLDLSGDVGAADQQKRRLIRTDEAAMTLVALHAAPNGSDYKPARDRLAGLLLAALGEKDRFRVASDIRAGDAPLGTQALAAYALTLVYDQTREAVHQRAAQTALAYLWANLEEPEVGTAFPWGPMAEFRWLALNKPQPGLLKLLDAIQVVRRQQVDAPLTTPTPAGQPGFVSPDIVGGFVLNVHLTPEPTWQSARVLAGLAAAPRARNVVDQQKRGPLLLDLAAGFAFLERLTFDEADTWYVHRSAKAIGGVRNALWDNRLTLMNTAMALLAAAELQQTVDVLQAKPQDQPAPERN